jgi:protein-S-isoprenylcysteine O-methyltransferase Ste14
MTNSFGSQGSRLIRIIEETNIVVTKSKSTSPIMAIVLLVFIIGVPLLPLIISARWDWWEAWVYAGVSILGFFISRLIAGRRHPDLLAERSKSFQSSNAESWDKILSPSLMLLGAIIPITAGLEMRFSLPAQFPLKIKILAALIIVFGYGIGAYAMAINRYFSGVVRIQKDRGHEVVNEGPYRWVRHPGYSGLFLANLAIPLLLDSVWTLIPVLLSSVGIIIRTSLEDEALQKKLPGYREYTQKVSFRLFPGIW